MDRHEKLALTQHNRLVFVRHDLLAKIRDVCTPLRRWQRKHGAISYERMLACGGYPWTVVRIEDRAAYLAALDGASIDADIATFANFVAERVRWSLDRARREAS